MEDVVVECKPVVTIEDILEFSRKCDEVEKPVQHDESSRLKSMDLKLDQKLAELEHAERAPLISREGKKKKRKKDPNDIPPTSGDRWFDVPNTPVTPEIEKTFKVLEMRPYLFKEQHYKKANKWKKPAFFGVGTVLDDPKDFYSSRVPKKQRKQTLADELLDDEKLRQDTEKKMNQLNEKRSKLNRMRELKSKKKKLTRKKKRN